MASETRPRKSTLSRIGKIFGVPEKQEDTPLPRVTNENNSQSSTYVASLPPHVHQTPISSNNSKSSSLNSSSSSLNQQANHDFQKQSSQVPKQPSKQLPSRTPSASAKHKTSSTVNIPSQLNEKLSQLTHPNSNNTTLLPPSSTNNTLLSRSSSTASNHPHHSNNINTASTTIISNNQNSRDSKHFGRFKIHEDGTHEHHLRNAKRQEKLSHMLKNLLGAQKLRDEAVSAVPDILTSNNPPSLVSGLVTQFSNQKDENVVFSGATRVHGVPQQHQQHQHQSVIQNQNFAERYGRCQEVVGKGTFGVVRIAHKKDSKSDREKLFAVKEFKRKPNETDQKYSRRLTSEFCISSSLKHQNIIETLDLLQDAKGDFVQVMEYCSGGDLYTLIISAGKLEYMEADCFFKQLIRGVVYMHEMGVAHRDLKPENLLLSENGILKITDFGNGECFKMAWEKEIHLSGGICGSSSYIAPEEYNTKEFDPRSVDIWACGVIYMAMRTGRHLWRKAAKDDEFFIQYLEGRKCAKGYEPIEMLKRARCRNVIYSILDPIPGRRINGKQILNSEWGREIKCCVN